MVLKTTTNRNDC